MEGELLIEVKVKKLSETAKMPTKAIEGDAGFDLYSVQDCGIYYQQQISTGIALEIPEGYCGIIKDKSGLALKGITTRAGVIDSGYRGEIKVVVVNEYPYDKVEIVKGQKIAQLLIEKVENIVMIEEELSNTKRGNKGFGSTGDF